MIMDLLAVPSIALGAAKRTLWLRGARCEGDFPALLLACWLLVALIAWWWLRTLALLVATKVSAWAVAAGNRDLGHALLRALVA